jgi:beta-phosphoglucomutase
MSRPSPGRDTGAPAAGSAAEVLRAWADHADRGVIFDFNGTLSDDEPILLEVFRELFAEHFGWELSAAEYYGRLAGHSDREIVEVVLAEQAPQDPGLVEELLRLRRERYQEQVARRSPISAGAVALVQRLAGDGVPMAIVTGAQRADVQCVLASSPAGEHLRLLVTEEDVDRGKPDPEGFLKGSRLLALEPQRVLVFEDSVPGVRAATAAGMPCIGVSGERGTAQLLTVTDAIVPALTPSLLEH